MTDSLDDALKEEFLFHLNGDDPGSAEKFLEGHPQLRASLEELAARHASLRRIIARWQPPAGMGAGRPGRLRFSPRETLGGYRLLGEIGRGGMGVVYRAEELATGKPAALKVIRPDALGPAEERFHREVEILRRLQSPHLIALYGSGSEDGIPYFAMELLEGETLGDLIGRWRIGALPGALRGGGQDRHRRLFGAGPGPRRGSRPPRPQAHEHLPHPGRGGEDHRLRSRPSTRNIRPSPGPGPCRGPPTT